MRILDENEILVTYIPASERALVFRVKALQNRDKTRIDYGPLPIPEGTALPTYVGTVATVPEVGVLPAYAFTPTSTPITFPLSEAIDEKDMWYLPAERYADRLFHVIGIYSPSWLRTQVEIPIAVVQDRFQKDKVTTGVPYIFGFSRGYTETVHIPGIRYGYLFGNDTSMSVYTRVTFYYGEYLIEVPKDPEFVFNVLQGRVKAYWITLPIIATYDRSISDALEKNYGFEGFKLYPVYEKEKAIAEYKEQIKEVKA